MGGEVLTDTEIRRERAIRGRQTKRVPIDILVEEVPGSTGRDRNSLPVVAEGLKIIDPKRETFEERSERFKEQRKKYSSMQAHMELAATVLAAGGTFKQAAAKAGVSNRQVRKYYTDPDFRARIEELRQTIFSKIRGRLYKELERRTKPGSIERIELLDLLRIFDRVAGPVGGKAGVNIAGDVNVTQSNHDTIIAALLAPVIEGESADFPHYEPADFHVPGEGAPE